MSNDMKEGTDQLGAGPLVPISPLSTFLGLFTSSSEMKWLLGLNLALAIGLTFAAPSLFPTRDNLYSMAGQFPGYGLLALAMVPAMLMGGIDLSVVAVANLAAIAAALLMRMLVTPDMGAFAVTAIVLGCCMVALLVGLCCGVVNGLLIDAVGISPILATLSSSLIVSGLAIVITQGTAVIGLPDAFNWIGQGFVVGLPVPVVLFIGMAVLLHLALTRLSVGANIQLIGSNPVAARYAGINIRTVTLKSYAISSFYAACAGLVIAARANSAKADYGSSYLLLSILICILGGISPFGGRGKVLGVVLAVLALQLLSSGLNILGVNNFAVDLVWGITLLLILAINQRSLLGKR